MKIKSADFTIGAHRARDFVRDDRPQIVFSGRSNVGKSSLINKMLRRNGLARTSSTPGRTRAVNYFLINERFYFVDLPGFGYAKASKKEREAWARLIDGYLQSSGDRILVVLLVDAKIEGSPLDAQAIEYFESLDLPLVVAATKIDRISRNKRARCLSGIAKNLGLSDRVAVVPVSAHTGEGLDDLWKTFELN